MSSLTRDTRTGSLSPPRPLSESADQPPTSWPGRSEESRTESRRPAFGAPPGCGLRGEVSTRPCPLRAYSFRRVPDFPTPSDLKHNRGLISDPEAFAHDANAASWLFLCGDEFAVMEGGMSYEEVQAAVASSANIVSDPPCVMDMDLARQQIAALDQLPRPTLVTCAPALAPLPIYLYAGRRAAPRSTKCWRGPKRTAHLSAGPRISGRGSHKGSTSFPDQNDTGVVRTPCGET